MMLQAAAPAIPMKVLLVDAERGSLETRSVILSTHGYDVQSVATVAEAQQHCRDHGPDLILVGLSRKAVEVFNLLHQVRAANLGRSIGFLMHQEHALCSVSFNGRTIREHVGPDQLLLRVATLPGRGNEVGHLKGKAL